MSVVGRPGDIVELLRDRGPLPAAQIVESRDVSRSTTMQEIGALVRDGLVAQGMESRSRGGRPSRVVELSEAVQFLAIDVGTASISAGITNAYLEVVATLEEPTDLKAGPASVMAQIEECARRLTGDAHGPLRVSGVGMGIPSPVSIERGEPVDPALMPGWDRFPVGDQLSQKLGIPVTVDKDANLMVLGEGHRGAAQGVDDYLFVKLGSGISCGIVVGGALYRGHSGAAGDIGHVSAGDSNVLCHCGRRGCLEAQVGADALSARALAAARSGESPFLAERLASIGSVVAYDLALASAAGDPAAARIIREAGALIGEALSALVNFFNPQSIVLGGPSATFGPPLLSEVHSMILKRSSSLSTAGLEVIPSTLGKTSGLIGAARLASDTFLDSLSESR
ncbi:MAG: ROK family protein [Microbacterium sp.]|uniref:ROK family protein n=1 Tax=Microbacterium sp. TaxID=51671 RepID=UPI003F7FB40A